MNLYGTFSKNWSEVKELINGVEEITVGGAFSTPKPVLKVGEPYGILKVGIRGVDPKKFLLLNGLGAIVWAISFSLIGYAAGTALKSFLEKFDKFHNVALIALLVLGIGVAVWYFWRKRRK